MQSVTVQQSSKMLYKGSIIIENRKEINGINVFLVQRAILEVIEDEF